MKVCRRETFNAAHRLFNPTFDDAKNQRQPGTQSTIMPVHAASRMSGQRLGQTPVEAEDMLPICGQGSVLVYTKASDVDLGTYIFGVLNVVETRREITVERFFKAQLQAKFHDTVCSYATGSDRFLYLFVTLVIGTTIYKTRSGAHITALTSIVDQAIADLEGQSGMVLRCSDVLNG
jgi:porphobilinogen deaminase